MNKIKLIIPASLLFLPVFVYAQVAQIAFTTSSQSILPNSTSSAIIIEAQDESGNATKTPETIHLEFLSTSATGEFLGSTGTTTQKFISTGTTKRTFYYKDSSEGQFILTINASSSASSWSASQDITITASSTATTTDSVIEEVSVFGTIASDTTWSPEEGTYVLEDTVTVAASTTLTILPGTVIKGKNGGAGILVINGTLVAEGTDSDRVYFTSSLDDEVGGDSNANGPTTGSPGDWQGIYFTPGSTGSLDYVEVRYAGYGPGFPLYGHFVGIENDGGTLDIKHSNIKNNYKIISNGGGGIMSSGKGIYNKKGALTVSDTVIERSVYGIFVESGIASISHSVLQNNNDSTGYSVGYGIYAAGDEPISLLDNTFISNGKTAFINAQAAFSHAGNTSTDTVNRGYERSGAITDNIVWETRDLPFIIPNGSSIWVNAGKTLTINPGTALSNSGPRLDL